MAKDSLGDRMKAYYEDRSRICLNRRTPVIIRLDGKAFHSLTRKHCEKGFDENFSNSMNSVANKLLNEVQGAKIAYTQSDEISLVLTDYDTLETQAWFDYNIQKISSISASMATLAFNLEFFHEKIFYTNNFYGYFDARCFNIPKDDVMNYLLWRQKDCIKNSINMLSRLYFSDKELEHKSCNDRLDMLYNIGKNWNNVPERYKYGYLVFKTKVENQPAKYHYLTEEITYNHEALNEAFLNEKECYICLKP